MFGSKGRKERKRLIALLLAGAMVLSGMGISPISVQAEETATAVEQVQETEPVETIVEEQGEETVSGGDVVMPEAEETEVLETEETGEASAPVVQNADGIYVFEAAIDAIISKLEKRQLYRKESMAQIITLHLAEPQPEEIATHTQQN